MRIPPLLAVILLLLWPMANAEIFKWVDAEGNTHFGDQPPDAAKTQTLEFNINTFQGVEIDQRYSHSGDTSADHQTVIMYSTSWCGYCKKARRYFRSNNINFKEYDIEKNASAAKTFKRLGGKGVPLIVVGDKKMSGFSQSGFESIYR
ncbi:hypothetical protein SIN8267_02698 [Sinobacterium norvegicum]|uniref:Glutaredoxin n=1 Tax=Sinobacterium norvegicum TaxID=1641715 RepID=A0ABM9AH76_9GAMM|nr:glutaredoxin domain-containing protein [Sinobacterium norvegicum]CAH0992565.1 hypothetical protein SIN8267_02698 [Sinobacterium norvegicum]